MTATAAAVALQSVRLAAAIGFAGLAVRATERRGELLDDLENAVEADCSSSSTQSRYRRVRLDRRCRNCSNCRACTGLPSTVQVDIGAQAYGKDSTLGANSAK